LSKNIPLCYGTRNENLVRRPERKMPLGRRGHRREDNIKMDLRAVEWESVDCIHLAEHTDQWWAVVNTVMNLRVP